MSLPAQLLKVRLADPLKAESVGRLQDNVGTLLNEVAAVPILQAVALTAEFEIVAGSTDATVEVAHGLGREWVGWVQTDLDQLATLHRPSDENPARLLTLTATIPAALASDVVVTVGLLVW